MTPGAWKLTGVGLALALLLALGAAGGGWLHVITDRCLIPQTLAWSRPSKLAATSKPWRVSKAGSWASWFWLVSCGSGMRHWPSSKPRKTPSQIMSQPINCCGSEPAVIRPNPQHRSSIIDQELGL